MHISWRHAWNPRLVVMAILAIMVFRVVVYLSTDNLTSDLSFFAGAANISTIRHALPPHASSAPHPTANRTLGFERVIVVSLPERSDKRDALDLMASLSEIDLDWEDGVKASSIPEKAVPHGISLDRAKENFLGSWRGHMNAIRRVVEAGISSALILEDDVDWDVHLKSQLFNISRGARHVLGEAASPPTPDSPYGHGWDVLWLGHCGEVLPETLDENLGLEDDAARAAVSAKYAIEEDETMPPYSESAARKILYALSVDGLTTEFDNALAGLCRDGRSDASYHLKCLSVNPAIMFHHKPKGRVAGDSDINSQGQDGGERETGFTESIKWSMRLNLKNILLGKPLVPQFEG